LTHCEGKRYNRFALRGQSAPKRAISQGRRGPVSHAPRLDEVDKSIIEALQKNGRESFRRIAAQIGVSEATVRARYSRLCASSILQVTGVTNPLGLGFEAMAMVGVRVTGPPEPIAEEIGSWEEAGYVVITDRRDLLDATNRIRGLEAVVSTETFLYLDLWKQLYDWGAHVTRTTSGEEGSTNGR
jgi:Lrp/AsnC family transcriptional regulator, regulator for asnA, asnC and gidA